MTTGVDDMKSTDDSILKYRPKEDVVLDIGAMGQQCVYVDGCEAAIGLVVTLDA